MREKHDSKDGVFASTDVLMAEAPDNENQKMFW